MQYASKPHFQLCLLLISSVILALHQTRPFHFIQYHEPLIFTHYISVCFFSGLKHPFLFFTCFSQENLIPLKLSSKSIFFKVFSDFPLCLHSFLVCTICFLCLYLEHMHSHLSHNQFLPVSFPLNCKAQNVFLPKSLALSIEKSEVDP